MSATARILDANFNRAREAMRVMEDGARFALNDANLCESLKSMRHALREIADRLQPAGGGWLEANRDTPGDVGTAITTPAEKTRNNLLDVVIAAGKRLSESLRVIEELCKTIDPELAGRVESLRYRSYSIDAELQAQFGTGRAVQWKLCLLLTQSLCKGPWRETLAAALDAGVDCVQVREKHMEAGELLEHSREVIAMARPNAAVIVNDRLDVALAAGADGVHVGQHDLPIAQVRRIAGRSLLIGASTHTLEEAACAVRAGADYCGVGAMFDTALKPKQPPSGPGYLRAFVERFCNTPHLAIGGVTLETISRVVEAGAQGVAVSSAICGADDPGAVVRSLRNALTPASAVLA